MNAESDIRLGTNGLRIGQVYLDATAVRGEGGWHDPRLVVPLEVTLEAQPSNHMIAITQLAAAIGLSQNPGPNNRIGPAVIVDLLKGFHCCSFPSRPNVWRPELRFHLTQPQVKLLEDARHAAPDNRLTLFLHLDAHVVWLRHTGNDHSPFHPEESTLGEGGWDTSVGMFSETIPFWNPSISDLRIEIEPSTWVDRVLPGLGYDHVRLVEIGFSHLPDVGNLAVQFDKARRKYDAGDYDGCVLECRGVQNMWEQAMKATRNQHIANRLAAALHWPADDWHVKMVDSIWKGYADMVNAPHHPERTPQSLPATAADARLCLLLAAALSEYLERLRRESAPGV